MVSPPQLRRRLIPIAAVALVGAIFTTALDSQTSSYPPLPLTRSELQVAPQLLESPKDTPGLRTVSAVDVDRDGRVYILQRGVTNPVVVTDRTGKVLRTWGEGLFSLPHGLRVDPSGNVWTTDANSSMVYKFSPTGATLLAIAVAQYRPRVPNTERWVADARFVGPTDIAFAPDGHVLVADGYGNARIVEFDAGGAFVREWGRPGRGPGEFRLPHAIAFGPDGLVYVADRENGRVERFTRDGTHVGEWKYGGRVYGIDFSPDGDVYVGHQAPGGRGLDGEILKVDGASGRVAGAVDAPVHEIAAGPGGALFAGTQTGHVAALRP